MFTRRTIVPLLAPVFLVACTLPAQQQSIKEQRYDIGRIATAEEIRGWDIDVSPDGAGLPPGSGTAAEGRKVYEAKCLACHGANGAGGTAPRLTGGIGTLASKSPIRTIGSFWPYAPTIFDYVNRSMPWDKPFSLTPNEVYSVTAYLLHADGVIPEAAVMNATTLPQVRMPNHKGFVDARTDPFLRVPRCMTNCGM